MSSHILTKSNETPALIKFTMYDHSEPMRDHLSLTKSKLEFQKYIQLRNLYISGLITNSPNPMKHQL